MKSFAEIRDIVEDYVKNGSLYTQPGSDERKLLDMAKEVLEIIDNLEAEKVIDPNIRITLNMFVYFYFGVEKQLSELANLNSVADIKQWVKKFSEEHSGTFGSGRVGIFGTDVTDYNGDKPEELKARIQRTLKFGLLVTRAKWQEIIEVTQSAKGNLSAEKQRFIESNRFSIDANYPTSAMSITKYLSSHASVKQKLEQWLGEAETHLLLADSQANVQGWTHAEELKRAGPKESLPFFFRQMTNQLLDSTTAASIGKRRENIHNLLEQINHITDPEQQRPKLDNELARQRNKVRVLEMRVPGLERLLSSAKVDEDKQKVDEDKQKLNDFKDDLQKEQKALVELEHTSDLFDEQIEKNAMANQAQIEQLQQQINALRRENINDISKFYQTNEQSVIEALQGVFDKKEIQNYLNNGNFAEELYHSNFSRPSTPVLRSKKLTGSNFSFTDSSNAQSATVVSSKSSLSEFYQSLLKWGTDEDALKAAKAASLQEKNKQGQGNEALKQRAQGYGFECVNVEKDGNCFFHAVLEQLRERGGSDYANYTNEQLRTIAIQHIINNQGLYEQFIPGGFANFVAANIQNGAWADNLMIQALSRELNINIVVVRNDDNLPNIIRRPNPDTTVYLGYEAGQHYQSLVGQPTNQKLVDRFYEAEVDRQNFRPINNGQLVQPDIAPHPAVVSGHQQALALARLQGEVQANMARLNYEMGILNRFNQAYSSLSVKDEQLYKQCEAFAKKQETFLQSVSLKDLSAEACEKLTKDILHRREETAALTKEVMQFCKQHKINFDTILPKQGAPKSIVEEALPKLERAHTI